MLLQDAGGVRVGWDDAAEAVRISITPASVVDYSAESARRTIRPLARVIEERGSLRLLVDARHAQAVTVDCMLVWIGFVQAHRDRIHMVIHDAPPSIVAMIALFRRIVPARIDVAKDEAEARAMLAPVSA